MVTARFLFQDGEAIEVDVAEGETVAAAALRQDAPLRTDCLSGDCGACIARCADTAILTGDKARIILPDEAAEGLVATCCSQMLADGQFQLDYPLHPSPSEPMRLRGEVTAHMRMCDTVSRLVITLDDADDFRFQPGQYLRLRPPGIRAARAFSIASTMADLPHVELLIRHLDGGQVSGWLESGATLGAKVVAQAPLGGFAADTRASRQIFIAGGTGLAPMLSMIRDQAAEGRDLLLCFGCTRAEELFYHQELQELAQAIPGLEIRIALMEGAHGTMREGTALALLAAEDLVEGCACHLCGPPAMVNASCQFLRDNGVPAHAIRSERFSIGI